MFIVIGGEIMLDEKFINGKWRMADEEPYYPSLFEKITHWFGKHWYYEANHCLICGRKKI